MINEKKTGAGGLSLALPIFLALAVGIAVPADSRAGLLGQTVTYSSECCVIGASPFDSFTKIVGSADPLFDGSEVGTFSSIDITDTEIIRVDDGEYSAATFNGDVFYFPNVTIDNVTIDQLPGPGRSYATQTFDPSRVTFDSHDVYINWQGGIFQTYTSDGQTAVPLILGITVSPEPGTLVLFLTGVAAALVLRRRKAGPASRSTGPLATCARATHV